MGYDPHAVSLLIVPVGIEIIDSISRSVSFDALLIVPVGIEMCSSFGD